MGQRKTSRQLSRFLSYVLGRRPDEFGLVPDSEGFVKLKEFFKAIHEEEGWKYVRKAHIDEILISLPNSPVEIRGDFIRAVSRENLSEHIPTRVLPKNLFTCVRRKAYPIVLERGLSPGAYPHVVLSQNPDMAQRIGKRIDPEPIVLTVHTRKALDENVVFYQVGDQVYRAEFIPAGCFTGPFLPKPKAETKKRVHAEQIQFQRLPGSYLIDFKNDRNGGTPRIRGTKIKEDTRQTLEKKKKKRKRERPPWRS